MNEGKIDFEAPTQIEANQLADNWWAKQKGLRLVHRSQVSAGFGGQQDRWTVTIHYESAD
jgi:hypothetical protein